MKRTQVKNVSTNVPPTKKRRQYKETSVMTICVIPARGGSKRIHRKNIKEFHGKPIIQYSIEVANKSGMFDVIFVSTEDDEIANIAMNLGAAIIWRPKDLADDTTGTQEVMQHACKDVFEKGHTMFDLACCIYATSPLLGVDDLKRGRDRLLSNRSMMYAMSIGTSPLRDAGNYYWGRAGAFIRDIPIHDEFTIMVPIESDRVCDINTPDDWAKAEEMYGKLQNKRILGR